MESSIVLEEQFEERSVFPRRISCGVSLAQAREESDAGTREGKIGSKVAYANACGDAGQGPTTDAPDQSAVPSLLDQAQVTGEKLFSCGCGSQDAHKVSQARLRRRGSNARSDRIYIQPATWLKDSISVSSRYRLSPKISKVLIHSKIVGDINVVTTLLSSIFQHCLFLANSFLAS